ncbi:hypothetical protein ACFLSJ_00990 [Verrucomicrobiota bacterium]
MNARVRRIVEASGGSWSEYRDNEWNGADRTMPGVGTLRICQDGGEQETVEMYRFDSGMLLEWQASFSASAPVEVAAAAVRPACGKGGGG